MKQILQDIKEGITSVSEVPCPKHRLGELLIRSNASLISAGTERMLIEFGRAGLIDKARQQPDKVKQVLDKIRTDGLLPTVEAVRSKLDQPMPLGYCNVGIVVESGTEGFAVGDRVVSNGNHAEIVRVPKNLCAKIPEAVDDESAVFTVLGAVGLQGIRLLNPTIGEGIVVIGLGLIGLLCVQMLRANGCRVLGIDIEQEKCKLAREFGATTIEPTKGEDIIEQTNLFSRGHGVDGVLITASSKSHDILHTSAEICRKRGRIVLVGMAGLNLKRDDFFKKELTFQVSASYGPGRYDPLYEDKGLDYPIGFVCWTEQRNFEAVLDMMDSGALEIKSLISQRINISDAAEAYKLLDDSSKLGIVLKYGNKTIDQLLESEVHLDEGITTPIDVGKYEPVVGFIGAGNYSSRVLIPAFKKRNCTLDTIVTSGGISAVHHGKKAGFRIASTDLGSIWENETINTVAIVTRHNEHTEQVVSSLQAGKNVFVEKPLALNKEQLGIIDKAYRVANKSEKYKPMLMVGFNRRFSPHIIKMKKLLETKKEPKTIIMTINAGAIPASHWTQDKNIGGGRIIGEVCHYIDLFRYLIGYQINGHQAMKLGPSSGIEIRDDKVTITLCFADGSFGTIHYLANGGKKFPKERIEVFCGNAVLQMNNYRHMRGYGWSGFKQLNLWKQDKGQDNCVEYFLDAIREGKPSPIPYNELIESTRITIEVAESLQN